MTDTGVKIVGGKQVEEKGITIVGRNEKGTKVLDKDAKTPSPPVEVSIGEGDRDE